MEMIRTENLSFTYPGGDGPAVSGISLCVRAGGFAVVCGPSGCGKTTLLKCLKREAAPHGRLEGSVLFRGQPLRELDAQTSARGIGFVRQDPEGQIVTDTVWHELAFGLENLGVPTPVIRRRVAETAHFFGMGGWFGKKTDALSGGQKQILNLAAVIAMQPDAVVLDEPTAQLDPVAAKGFVQMLWRVNRELGTTVVLSEHRLEDVLPMADTAMLLESGRVAFSGTAQDFARHIAQSPGHPFAGAMPGAVRIAAGLGEKRMLPLTVREGRAWLHEYIGGRAVRPMPEPPREDLPAPVLRAKDVWFRYEADGEFALRGFCCDVRPGRMLAIVGGNASGKTTALGALCGLLAPVRGSVKLYGRSLSKTKPAERGAVAMLPQDPKLVFVHDSVGEDLMEAARAAGKSDAEKRAKQAAQTFGAAHLWHRHPYDISCGEQQKAAMARLMLTEPEVLLLDEPMKGIDAAAKAELGALLRAQCENGCAVVVVTHDIEFAAQYADDAAMMFDGAVASAGAARAFFAGNAFYTTSANRIAREAVPGAVVCEDVIGRCARD